MPDHPSSFDNIARRHVPLQGGCNFRDIGGYRTADGRSVRWGQVFRTGVLCYLTEADHHTLRRLGVRGIFDLRRQGEREREPTCWPDAVSAYTWDDGADAPNVMRYLHDKETSAEGMRAAMIDLYRALPAWLAPRIRDFLQALRELRSPVVVHCAAGKDRTGFAIAMLLLTLGVAREDVVYDYLLTNEVGNLEQFMLNRQSTQLGVTDVQHPLAAMEPERRRALLIADEAYLNAAIEQIEREYGGIDNYIERALGVNPDARRELRELFLTAVA